MILMQSSTHGGQGAGMSHCDYHGAWGFSRGYGTMGHRSSRWMNQSIMVSFSLAGAGTLQNAMKVGPMCLRLRPGNCIALQGRREVGQMCGGWWCLMTRGLGWQP